MSGARTDVNAVPQCSPPHCSCGSFSLIIIIIIMTIIIIVIIVIIIINNIS